MYVFYPQKTLRFELFLSPYWLILLMCIFSDRCIEKMGKEYFTLFVWLGFIDGGPTLSQHWVDILCLLGFDYTCDHYVAHTISLYNK